MSHTSKVSSFSFGRGIAAAALLITLLGARHATAQIEVPADFVVLQDAIDAAAPNDTIVIDSGEYAPITITKSLTLVGRGERPVILAATPAQSGGHTQIPTITLAGPGSGVVTLSNLATAGETDGFVFGSTTTVIDAHGFDELRILHCDIAPPKWEFLTGFAKNGMVGITTSIPWLLVEDSSVTGGHGDDDNSGAFTFDIPCGNTGISSSGTVTLVDSVVRGGDGLDTVIPDDFPFGCPNVCGDIGGGTGGDGVNAAVLQLAGSVVQGGHGARVSCFETGSGTTTTVCDRADGAAIVAGTVVEQLPGTLLGSGPLTLGDAWSLSWSFAAPSGLLLVSLQPTPGVQVGLKGSLFMSPSPILMFNLPGGGLQNASFDIPDDPALSGLTVAIQTFAPGDGLSRPVFGTLLDS